jgi:pimeloyl-ACP methyl ester carboxylesterase
MPGFESAGVAIDYLDEGEGPAVVLVHGFASNRAVNWVNTGWTAALTAAGYRVLAPDMRGHGRSAKLYEPLAYRTRTMAADVVALLDHTAVGRAVLMGYSMGARISAFAALSAPDRLRGLVLSGLASSLVEGIGGEEAIARALEAPSAAQVTEPQARAFRVFAEQTEGDLRALAACIRAARQVLTPEEVARIAAPTLVVAGEKDEIAGSADALAAMMPNARGVTLPGRDHMTAVGDRRHRSEVLAFLEGLGPA